jgi:hypothetical protein
MALYFQDGARPVAHCTTIEEDNAKATAMLCQRDPIFDCRATVGKVQGRDVYVLHIIDIRRPEVRVIDPVPDNRPVVDTPTKTETL